MSEQSVEAPPVETPSTRERSLPDWVVPTLCVLWLIGKLWASHQQIKQSADGHVALATAAAALPGVFQAVLLGALGAGLLAVPVQRPVFRWVAPVAAGLVVGGATTVLIRIVYPHMPSLGSIAAGLLISGAVGGAVAAARPLTGPLLAGAGATLAALIATTVLNSSFVLSRMLRAFGGNSSAQSYVHASKLVQYTDFVVIGLVAGILGYVLLRRRGDRRFPAYLLAGATAGLVLLVAYGLTRLGGNHLLDAAKSLSAADRLINDWESAESVPNAMIVLFVGAFTTLIAFGRKLKPAAPVIVTPIPRSGD